MKKHFFWTTKYENLVNNTFNTQILENLDDWAAQNNYFKKLLIHEWHISMKHLDPYFLTTLVKSKYLGVLLRKYGAHKSKHNLKPLLSQDMVHFTWQTKSVHMD